MVVARVEPEFFAWGFIRAVSGFPSSPASGSTPGSITVSVNATGLSTGVYNGHVIVTASGIANSPQSIPVSLEVLSQDMNENFSDSGNGWIISPMGNANGWSVSNGVYSYAGIGLSQSCAGNSAWTDYTLDSNIQLSNLSDWPGGVRGRVNPSTDTGHIAGWNPALGKHLPHIILAHQITYTSFSLLLT